MSQIDYLDSSDDATFDGVWLGPVTYIDTSPLGVDRQINSYPGINGIEVLTMGDRGFESEGHGAFVGNTGGEITAQFATMWAYQQQGGGFTLVDQDGIAWSNVILLDFKPDGGKVPARGGGFARKWKAHFLHVQPVSNNQ